MKPVLILFGVLGLADAVLIPVLIWLELVPGFYTGGFGFVGACVCFGTLAVLDALSSGGTAVVASKRHLPTADEVLGPE